ncbi:MAG: acyl-ACP thioesterase [Lactobacillaceae bacterium]|jgi:medium-chain acyl-[acyl-carrier-protein] hydrolase|nr:acyl-ACP thioesterase [Lactobacillaceae bacterium]
MVKTFEQTIKIPNYLVDRKNHLTIPAIPRLAIATSIFQSEELDVGMEQLHQKGLGWVILQYEIDVKRLAKTGESVVIHTSPNQRNEYFSTRSFEFLDDNNNQLISIKSLWAMIDLKRRKLVKLNPEITDVYETPVVTKVDKLPSPNDINNVSFSTKHIVSYFETDTNKHANNGSYFDWFFDGMPEEFLENHSPKKIIVKYQKEVVFGDELVINIEIKDNKTIHQIISNNVSRALAEIWWEEGK